jgi:SMI1 / KNR4 family (SUKH-1)
MTQDTWQKIDGIFQEHPVLRADEVPYEEIDDAAVQAGFQLDADYREFVHRYGGAIVGPYPVYGLRKAHVMGRKEGSVFDLTRDFRGKRWPGVNEWLVFSMDHAGNPVGFDKDGKVWISDHDAGVVDVIAKSFEDYLRKRCLKMAD